MPWWLFRVKQDFLVFVRLFPWRVAGILLLGLLITALFFEVVYNRLVPPSEHLSYVQAVLSVIQMMQLGYEIPAPEQLDPFIVFVPLLGLPLFFLFGLNILNVLRIFFVRAERGQVWQATLASIVKDHIVICGLGRVGYRVANQIAEFQVPVVGVNDVRSSLVDALLESNLPVLVGDVREVGVLRQAGVERARTVVVCTNYDLVNIEAAFHARELNPGAHIVLRLFEDEIAEPISASFDVDAIISRSSLAAVAFAHAAVGVEIIETFQLDDRMCALARVPLDAASPLLGSTLAEVGEDQDVTVVFHRREDHLDLEPDLTSELQAGDELFVFSGVGRLGALVQYGVLPDSSTPCEAPAILVCGLGHTGYRVVLRLMEMGQSVIPMDLEPGPMSQRLVEQGIPVRFGDFRQPSALAAAGAANACAMVACTEDDMINLEVILRVREINPRIRTVLRLFEEGLGKQLQETFGINTVYSTSAIASPAFVSAALQVHMAQLVEVSEAKLFLARLKVRSLSALLGVSLKTLDSEEGLTVVLHMRNHKVVVPPEPEICLKVGDEIVVLASQEKLRTLTRRNRSLGEMLQE